MHINQATDYAFRAVLFLAQQPKGKVVEAQVIARKEVIPMRFLLKIMPSLIKAGIVKSQRGVGGGYYLAKDPRDISFLDVVTAIEGPVAINRCLIDPEYCSKKGPPGCKVHRALDGIQKKLYNELKNHNFGNLIN
ncbi:AsnC family transcriptional regulator [Thermincola ferriacetica]|uniref:Transcriptional regulator, BadM/Rrf2 family n=2 Tax=Thermincola TaxID=278993 RepID=D5XD70_THEPJ|nr:MULTISPECIES: Rrf2 family transcriptional regulator [Thermincola]ADG81718.1 transcriptional regulator, BadM/Rrf2 family [Thermincola potens JR]KNZ69083.1 AsnC family transcriptional regulator [Thermincola ferriacetica]